MNTRKSKSKELIDEKILTKPGIDQFTNKQILRQQAEQLMKKKSRKVAFQLSEIEAIKLVHELEVHQIELELQNEELKQAKEKAIELASEKYAELYDFAPSGYFTLSKEGEIIDLNLCGSQMLGRERSHLKKCPFVLFVPPDSKPEFNDFLRRVLKSNTKESCEVILSTDAKLTMDVQLIGIATENGEQCLVTAVDISERRRAEEVIKESERFLKETQLIAKLGTYSTDIINGTWTSSEILDHIFGIETGFERSVEGWVSIIHPDWQNEMADYFRREVIGNKFNFDKEYKIIRQNDKAERWVHGIGNLKFNNEHQPVKMVGTIRDITERKQSEEALKKSEILLKSSIEAQKDTILLSIDREYRYLYFNKAHWESMKYGYNSDVKIGMNILDCITCVEDRNIAKENYDRALLGESHSNVRQYGNVKYAWYESFFNPIVNENNEIIGASGLARNITERIRVEEEIKLKNEELQKINAEKDRYFSIIAHDLRSPFSGFLGLTELMAKGLPQMTLDEIQKITLLMRNSATNLFRLLGNLLEWSRMQRGLTTYIPTSFLLKPKIAKIMVWVLEGADQKEITVNYSIPEDLVVYADGNMFEAVIRNLVSNAVKFTPHGGRIIISAKSAADNSVEISVTDSGIGMNQKMLNNLFRLDVNTNRKGTQGEYSTGLGLTICRDFIEKHGGKLHIESEEKKGSTFSFTLPANPNFEVEI